MKPIEIRPTLATFRLLPLILVAILLSLLACDQPETTPTSVISEGAFIVLNESTLTRADTLMARFLPPFNEQIYVDQKCFDLTGWRLFNQDASGEWQPTGRPHHNPSACVPGCRDNFTTGSVACAGTCLPGSIGPRPVRHTSSPLFEWNLEFYDVRLRTTCGDREGDFEFVDPAPSGAYMLRYEYCKDAECQTVRFAEAFFTIS